MTNESKRIEFRDSHYKEMFTIPDGESVTLTLSDGEKITRVCHYIDPYHFRFGSNVYHIDEWAEIAARNGNTYAPAN